jgi:hypothetical protein
MTPRFHAHRVDILETPTYRLVGFADRTNDTADYLMLQRGIEKTRAQAAMAGSPNSSSTATVPM